MTELPNSLALHPDLDTWVRIDPAETVTVFTGKVELGQGLVTALARIAAHELDVAYERVRVVTADTDHGLNELLTVGSMSMSESGSALRQATAEARAHLLDLAAAALGTEREALAVNDGTVRTRDGDRHTTYWELLGGRRFERQAEGRVSPKPAEPGRTLQFGAPNRAHLRAIVTGTARFVCDLRHEGMAFGRVVRPPSPHATLAFLDHAVARDMPGIVEIVRNGSFLGVVAEREDQAARAAEVLRARSRWSESRSLPPRGALAQWLRDEPGQAFAIVGGAPTGEPPEPEQPVEWTHAASYTRPYLMHGSIGPSAAMALWENSHLTVWSASQGVYVLREGLAATFGLEAEQIRCVHVPGPGCYGHNGADDAAFDAALLARAVPGRAVLLQWSRADEHQWEPYGAPALVEMAGVLDDEDRIVRWSHEAWGTTHLSRPLPGGRPMFLAGRHLEPPQTGDPPVPFLAKEAGIHRNAAPIYDLPDQRVVKHFVESVPLRTSSLRSLGAYANVLAIESFMDELAALRGISPVDFRLRHLSDERARAVLEAAVDAAGWTGARSGTFGRGTGIGLARYKNAAAYAAVVVRVRVEDRTAAIRLEEIVIAADCGEVVDPAGTVNQLEGGALQSASWTLLEQVAFDDTAVTSVDWETYPILRFPDVPSMRTVLVDRPGLPFLGTGEATAGPTAAAIANAVHDATGFRLRDTPFTAERVREAAFVA